MKKDLHQKKQELMLIGISIALGQLSIGAYMQHNRTRKEFEDMTLFYAVVDNETDWLANCEKVIKRAKQLEQSWSKVLFN